MQENANGVGASIKSMASVSAEENKRLKVAHSIICVM